MPKYKATAYIRLSYTDDHSSESDSVSNQRKLIENFVERNPDIEVVSEKIDDGYSGIIFDRPAFKEMMQDVTDGSINCVIVKDLSRLGREYIETGRYLRRVFPAYGVRFIAITDSIDTAGSICNAAKAIVEVGGANSVYACASHGVLSGPALERLNNSVIKEVALLNTIPESMGEGCDKIKYISVAPMFAEAIERIYQEISIAKLFN